MLDLCGRASPWQTLTSCTLLLLHFLCWHGCLIFTLASSSSSSSFTVKNVLDDYISHYHPVDYNHHELDRNHRRYKRSLTNHIILAFNAFDREFKLKLQKDNSIFAPDHVHQHSNGTREHVDTSFVYKGTVLGHPNSRVFGSIISKTFRGEISIPDEPTYHIEPSTRFFSTQQPFHSVIYSEKDLNVDPYKEKREEQQRKLKFHSHLGSCANDDVQEWMKSVQMSVIKPSEGSTVRQKREAAAVTEGKSRYSRSVNQNKKGTVRDRTCTLFLQSDPQLWQYMTEELKYNPTQARDEILSLFVNHVNAVKTIYEDTNFSTYDNSLNYVGVSFVVQRTTIMTPATENCNSQTPSQFCSPNIDVSNFLNQNSLTSHDDFCLAYIFTYRDFNGGTLGLAWVGSPNTAGGICEKFQPFPEGSKKVEKSLNTGIVTLVNFRQRVPPKVSQLTFAHEIGHNFGSPHDKSVECAPYGSSEKDANDGNYIMYASATSGDKKHNSMFSPCSKDNITRVLDAVINKRNGKRNCFVSLKAAFCGNKLVEEDEECDCGYKEDCANNNCCHYRNSKEGNECTLKPNANCSETSGPCCNGTTCGFIDKKLCHKEVEEGCTSDSYCDGKKATCTTQIKNNMTLCNYNSKVCIAGHCIGSVCRKIGWEECFLTPPDNNEQFDRELLCYVSCTETGQECISSKDTEKVKRPENKKFHDLLMSLTKDQRLKPLKLPAGSPCDNFRGYCDVFHRCRRVDAEGPLARLKNLIFNPETLQTIREWIIIHWWAVMLMCIGLVLFMAAFIKVCAVHTPSSNPRKPAARKLSLSSNPRQSRQMSAPRHQIPPPPYPGESYPAPHYGHGRGPRYDSPDYKGQRPKGGARAKDVELRNFQR
ncbi:disintegrin and metalloproteinase domain-containing protein 10 isoform X2 [Argonauta hians]